MINNIELNKNPVNIDRALISVFDKTNIIEFAQTLINNGVEILSTGGTAKALRKSNLPVIDVSDYTNFPEIMDGRVKTINPMVEGGILGLRDKHADDAERNNIKWIDLVVCNLYPFADTISREDCTLALALENVDIGGPTMIRSAAKNMGWVGVAINPKDYSIITNELNTNGALSFDTRKILSSKAFGHTAQYDTIIHNYLKDEKLSENFSMQASLGNTDFEITKLYPGTSAEISLNTKNAYTPENNSALSLIYSSPVENGVSTFRVDYTHQDESFVDMLNTPQLEIDAHDMINARWSLESSKGWTIALFGTNLSDERVIVGGTSNINSFGHAEATYSRPREYGVSIRMDF